MINFAARISVKSKVMEFVYNNLGQSFLPILCTPPYYKVSLFSFYFELLEILRSNRQTVLALKQN